MSDVLMSIQPKWVEKIANGKKTVEVRKSKPKLETPFKVYIYCTKSKNHFLQSKDNMFFYCEESDFIGKHGAGLYQRLNGKVIGYFVCDSFYGITNFLPYDGEDCHHSVTQGVLEQTCLEDYEIDEYLGKKDGYGWHISQLKIYDKPKELSEFKRWNRTEENIPCAHTKWLYPDCKDCKACNLTRPPQSWCYVEELKELQE